MVRLRFECRWGGAPRCSLLRASPVHRAAMGRPGRGVCACAETEARVERARSTRLEQSRAKVWVESSDHACIHMHGHEHARRDSRARAPMFGWRAVTNQRNVSMWM